MKKFILYIIKVLLCVAIMCVTFFCAIVATPKNIFSDTYQSVIQRKYDVLLNTNEPKIIVIAGSNGSFSLNEALLEEKSGYKVANLGLHAGFGAVVPTELAKANINAGDIVLLAYEWGWYQSGYFNIQGTDLVMSGFDHRLDMYAQLPISEFPKLFGYLLEHAQKKITHTPTTGIYSSFAFDSQGRMTYDRPEALINYDAGAEIGTTVDLTNAVISEEVIKYLTEFKQYVKKQGAEVYFVAPPIYEGACLGNTEDYTRLANLATEKLGIQYISDPLKYFFPNHLIYDTVYHCTTEGALLRTELLIEDLQNAGIIDA